MQPCSARSAGIVACTAAGGEQRLGSEAGSEAGVLVGHHEERRRAGNRYASQEIPFCVCFYLHELTIRFGSVSPSSYDGPSFKGDSETTFLDFPARLAHIIRETYGLVVESELYPTYETRGSLSAAVERFVEWLTEKCVLLESKPHVDPDTGEPIPGSGRGGGAGSVKVVLCGHSMGGLVAVDAALGIAHGGGLGDGRLWPRVCGVVAYDTPYHGVHPNVFKHGFNKYGGYVKTVADIGTALAPMGIALGTRWGLGGGQTSSNAPTPAPQPTQSASPRADASTSSSGAWGKWGNLMSGLNAKQQQDTKEAGPGTRSASSSSETTMNATSSATSANAGGSRWRSALMATGAIALAGGAAAGAYLNRERLGGAYGWVSDHLMFVGNLWDENVLRKRLSDIVELPEVLFHCYFTRLPARKARGERERTFIILPSRAAKSAGSFTPMDNTVAADEVEAHVGMFSPKANSSFYELGLRSAALIGTVLENERFFGDQIRSQAETEEVPGEESGLREGDVEVDDKGDGPASFPQPGVPEAATTDSGERRNTEQFDEKSQAYTDQSRPSPAVNSAPAVGRYRGRLAKPGNGVEQGDVGYTDERF